ncbi:KR domain-containing protein [Mycobacterium sherrisii]|uniref:KR domain-containing protein n=1 Tax=Mycobacterium sherrisii TaxID=243061 RepID=UPI0039768B13
MTDPLSQADKDGIALIVGAGQIGQAIAELLAPTRRIILADNDIRWLDQARQRLAAIQTDRVDLSEPDSIRAMFEHAAAAGPVHTVVHAAGIWPAYGTVDNILRTGLCGSANLIEVCGQYIAPGGAAMIISCLSGHWSPLNDDDQAVIGHVPARDLRGLPFLAPESLGDPLTAYRVAQRASQLRAKAASPKWSSRAARINSISAGTATHPFPLATLDTGVPPGPDSPTPSDIACATAFLVGPASRSVSGINLRIDGGATAARWSAIDSYEFDFPRIERCACG